MVVESEARPAGAHEAAKCVGTSSVVTQTVHVRALVDILQYDSLLIGFEARSAWTHQFVLSGAWPGTLLTPGTPGLA